jgi:hypothetical protein
MESNGIASDNLLLQTVARPQDESVTGHDGPSASIPPNTLLEQVLERPNLQRLLKQVHPIESVHRTAGVQRYPTT